MKRGAPLVVVDPDYGTQAMEFRDRDLVRKRLYDGVVRDGRFCWSVTFVTTSGRKS